MEKLFTGSITWAITAATKFVFSKKRNSFHKENEMLFFQISSSSL